MKNKLNMCAKRLEGTGENICRLETLRFKAYGLDEKFSGLTLYALGLTQGTMVPYGFFVNEQLVAGCYVSADEETLTIEQLFVHPQLQNSGLRAGRLLLNYVLMQKEELEHYFRTKLVVSSLEPSTDKAKALYEKMGYVQTEDGMKKTF
ncbi:MAG: GNAT family N-acetyltransferase [Bacilli bacterium]|nr:GNAT family N-acetyltransferase [Bacilli bacterium]